MNNSTVIDAMNVVGTEVAHQIVSPLKVWVVLLALVGVVTILGWAWSKGQQIIYYLVLVPIACLYFAVKILRKKKQ